MTWVRIDDHFDEHPKIAQLDDHAFALFIAGLAYCNRNLTDGFIPHAVGLGQLRWCDGNTVPSINALESVGLWKKIEGGWQVHDYADYQPSRADVLRAREDARERQAKAREKSRSRSQLKSQRDAAATSSSVTPTPVPVPNPVPDTDTEPEKPLAPQASRARDLLFEAVTEVCQINPGELTDSARGAVNKALKSLREVRASPAAVRDRAENWQSVYPDTTLTPTALAKHWPMLANARAPAPRRDRYVEMGRSLQERMNRVGEEGANGQPSGIADEARRSLPEG